MDIGRRWFQRPSLAAVTAAAAATVGSFMAIGGLALLFAALSTSQPGLQVATACALITAGVVNLWASGGIRREQPGSVLVSAVATTAFMLYLGAGLRDFGEPFWVHGWYLVLLIVLSYRARTRWGTAA